MVEKSTDDNFKSAQEQEQPSIFSKIWRFLHSVVWTKMLKPLIGGIIFGMGSMLGVVLVRYFVMEKLGMVPYKQF